jgi:glycosyltransferase involved in cell wall biosynthesis
LRLLAIAPTGFFADYGCHVRIRGQMAALRARGHAVFLVTYPAGRDVDGLATCRPPFWPVGRSMPVGSSRRKLLLDALLVPTAWHAALRFPGGRPDIIHAYLHEGALLGTTLARLLQAPLVFDFQGSLTSEMVDHRFLQPGSPVLTPLRWLERWIDRQPQAILASSQHAAGLLRQAGVAVGRIHTLPDSVDPRAFRPRVELPQLALDRLRQQLALPTGRPLLVYLGLLAPYQGTDLLLYAMQRLVQRRPAPHLLLMGFPDVATYRALAERLGLAGHVTFTGAVPYEAAPLHLALGDVAVAPKVSATEGSGKLLPYMAAGLPVVAFDTPVHREYLGELGVYAPAGDAAGLAAAIAWALDHPEAARRAAHALRARVVSCYTWDHAAEAIEQMYGQLRDANLQGNRSSIVVESEQRDADLR